MEADAIADVAGRLPSAETLLALARRRLDNELRALPQPGSVAWRAALLAESAPQRGPSFGALAHAVRVAARAGRGADAHDLFVALLKRIDGLNRRWVAGVLWPLPATASERRERAQDLAQDLTLLLWEQIGQRDDDAWELFFQRALAFAQSHVATAYLRRQGLRADPHVRQPERGLAVVFSRLADETGDSSEAAGPDIADAAAFTRAELADLRALVARLPARERLAVVMRFWQQASEAEIALALGGVTTRAVRYTLRRAYERLRAWYAGEGDHADAAGEEQE
jgi:DNA-directed RNA polymerase specialized sigma24 family protein